MSDMKKKKKQFPVMIQILILMYLMLPNLYIAPIILKGYIDPPKRKY
jgi:hypothetical protein